MKEEKIGVAKEGFPIIGLLAFSAVIFVLMSCEISAFLFLVLVWFSVFFFRDPPRVVPTDVNVAVSPADGKIIRIQPALDPISGETRLCISVFMNVFSVHVNRSPVAGVVSAIKYISGSFVNAAFDKASTENERCAYAITDQDGKDWTFVQISGLIARRIVCRVQEGDELARGERFGLIRFGSRVDLYLPKNYTESVGIGDKVFAGQSVLARKK